MNKNLSTYLELLRWLAAMGVFITHAGGFVMPWLPRLISDNGAECVAIFFVLSGFVIRFVSIEKEKDWRTYLSARMARLYSVVFVAIGVAIIADRVGMKINPAFYAHETWDNETFNFGNILSYVTFTNELWFTHSIVASDEPYWSLGFEVPYYVVFGIWLFGRGWLRWGLIAVWSLAVGPKILAYLPLWLMGAALYELLRRPRAAFRFEKILGAFLLGVGFALYFLDKDELFKTVSPMYRPWSAFSIAKSALYFYIVGAAVALNILGFDLIFRNMSTIWSAKVTGVVRWLAGGSFTLYLAHQPLLVCLRAAYPTIVRQPLSGALASIAVLCFVYALAELGERRKRSVKSIVDLMVYRGWWARSQMSA